MPLSALEPMEIRTNYLRERALFAQQKADLQKRKRAKWRLWLALRVAGRKPLARAE